MQNSWIAVNQQLFWTISDGVEIGLSPYDRVQRMREGECSIVFSYLDDDEPMVEFFAYGAQFRCGANSNRLYEVKLGVTARMVLRTVKVLLVRMLHNHPKFEAPLYAVLWQLRRKQAGLF